MDFSDPLNPLNPLNPASPIWTGDDRPSQTTTVVIQEQPIRQEDINQIYWFLGISFGVVVLIWSVLVYLIHNEERKLRKP